jgi:hypothetical protein
LRGECPRDSAADTAAAAGDCGYLTVELAHRLNLPLLHDAGIQTAPVLCVPPAVFWFRFLIDRL